MIEYPQITIDKSVSILDTLKRMDEVRHKSLLVYNGDAFFSLVTIGEIQRAIIDNVNLNTPVETIINRAKKCYAYETDSIEAIRQKMFGIKAELMPVLSSKGELVKLYTWSDFFKKEKPSDTRTKIDIPVVIMAGGKGTRLKPLTNVIPKPMIPVGERTILEEIMNQFESIGCSRFYMSVNFKVDILKYYLDSLEHKYNISFFQEEQPLGTIGSVSLLKGKINTPFFVSNCDIIIDQDYRDVYDYHQENHNDLTIVTAIKSFRIPYGVVETGVTGLLKGLKEKPEQTYMVNTGVYILNAECIDEIPHGEFFHITQLIEKIRKRGGRVGCFPVSENAWSDMGEWNEYLKMINVF